MSVYEIVTEQVLKQLESGTAPWRKPWRTEMPANLVTRKEYRGINPFLLAASGHSSRYWLTLRQTNKLGGRIRKGEHSSLVTFWHIGDERTVKAADGTERKSRPFLLRFYRVFNVEQTEGIPEKFLPESGASRVADLDECERIVAEMPNRPTIEASSAAWYRPATDTVGIPGKQLFNSAEEYYSTLFHELTHSTGHASRIGREGIDNLQAFGSESYSREELVAEMGAAFLCGTTGITPSTLANSAAYLNNWISRLKGDSRLIVSAASAAQKAADYILNRSTKSDSSESQTGTQSDESEEA